jgi:hypothetical protein
MVSSYLEQPLRTLEQALDDRARRPARVRPVHPDITDPDSVALLVRSLRENPDRDGARQQSPLDRRDAA